MKIPIALLAVFVAIASAAAQTRQGGDGIAPTFRAAVELTVVLVNVTDPDNRAAAALTRDDFVLLENGTPQPLAHFLSAGGAVDVVLLIDISGSITPVLSDLRRTVTDFVDALRPGDRVMVVAFDHRLRPLSPFTDDREELERAVGRVRPTGSTSLFDSVYITLKTLAASTNDFSRRRAVVVISDGEDTSSVLQPRDVRDQSTRCGVPIYVVLLSRPIEPAHDRFGSYDDKRRRFEVKALATETGGRMFSVAEGHGLRNAYRAIVDDLSQQYVLAYERTVDAARTQVTVQIPSRPSAIVKMHLGGPRTREGG